MNSRTSDNSSPLHLAISSRNQKSAEKLLDNGAYVNISDQNKKTPLCLAVEKGLHSLVENILQYNPDTSDKFTLKAAVRGYGEEYKKTLNILIKYGFTFDADEVEDYELLHTSVKKGYYQIVDCLINYGANPNSIKDGRTLLHNAIENGHHEIVKLLIM